MISSIIYTTRFLSFSSAKILLENLSEQTWQRLYYSEQTRITQGEETITDIFLLEFAINGYNSFRNVFKSTKQYESKSGIDWQWEIGSSKYGWIKYAVQAKKLYFDGTYNGLDKKVEIKNQVTKKVIKKILQIKLLDNYANAVEAVPLYCFYNYKNLDCYNKYWHCKSPLDIEQLGCTFTPLKNIKNAVGHRQKKFEDIHRYSDTLPLRCILSHPDILAIYKKNYKTLRKSGFAKSNSFHSELFGNVIVHNTLSSELFEDDFNRLISFSELSIDSNIVEGSMQEGIWVYPKIIVRINIGNYLEEVFENNE